MRYGGSRYSGGDMAKGKLSRVAREVGTGYLVLFHSDY